MKFRGLGFGILSTAFPLLLLFSVRSSFYLDWFNHLWAMSYYGEYFRAHFSMPIALNTSWAIGMAQPVFYGYLLYPLLGLFSAAFGSDVGIRVAIFAVMALQFFVVSKSLKDFKAPPILAFAVGCLVNWAAYPLTNLYNRSALTEFFAVAFLTCAVATIFSAAIAEDRRRRRLLCFSAGLFGVFSAGSHPITALLGVPFVGAALAYCFFLTSRERWRAMILDLIPCLILGALILAPWMYAVHVFRSSLFVTSLSNGIAYFFRDIDSVLGRLSPIPYDARIADQPWKNIATPYLEAPINDALLFLAIYLAWGRGLLRVLALPIILFLAYTILSFSPQVYDLLPAIFKSAQYAYRLVTYINLAILLFFYGILNRAQSRLPKFGTALVVFLVLGAVSVGVKLSHAFSIMDRQQGISSETMDVWTLFGWRDYTTPWLYQPLAQEPRVLSFSLKKRDELSPRPLSVDVTAPTWIGTNVLTFPWNKISIDGQDVAAPRSWGSLGGEHFFQAVEVPAGHHELTAHLVPDSTWLLLRKLSFLALLIWVGVLVKDLTVADSRGLAQNS